MRAIKEEDKVHEQWYKEANKQTIETLPAFVHKLMSEYEHDYGTICHALAAGAIATCNAMDADEKQGGITGFQAGAIMWEFIRHWNYTSNRCGLRILDYDNMLYPQYKSIFTTISDGCWKRIQEKAAELLKSESAAPSVREHWKMIVQGVIPFGFTIEE